MLNSADFIESMQEFRRLGSGGRRPPIEPQHGPPEDPEMEGRLKRVEDDVRELGVRMNAVESRLSALEAKVDALVREVANLNATLRSEVANLNATLRSKVAGPWQTFGLALGLLTAALTLPTAIARLLVLLP